jgi:hypothetical protein
MHVWLGNFLYTGNFGQETVRRVGTLASTVACNVEFDRLIDCRDWLCDSINGVFIMRFCYNVFLKSFSVLS